MTDVDETLRTIAAGLEERLGERALDPSVSILPTRLDHRRDGAPPEKPRPLDLPRIDPRDVEITGVLGEGGMGVVQSATQRSLEREVAVKRLHDDQRESRAHVRALLDEAKHTGSLEHPNIVPVYALGRGEDGAPRMVMKKVEGARWSEIISDAEHPFWDEVRGVRVEAHVRLVIQLCRALEFAHSRGILHRDIKPDNVLVGEFGEVVLLDWGLAVRLADLESVSVRECVGTPSYMAPEMITRSLGELGPATDVYLLGASLHHALTGEPPHSGNGIYAILADVIDKDAPTYGEEVPRELGAICSRSMEPDPKARFEDVAALRRALEDYLAHRASVELADAASERLAAMKEELEGERDAVRIRERFDAARFGFEQALRIWPENAEALDRAVEALDAMVRYHLAQKDVDAARALLAKLEALEGGEGLADEIAALEAEVAAEREEHERLKKLGHELDPSVSAKQRAIAMRALTALVVVAGSGLLVVQSLGIDPPPWVFATGTGFAASLVTIVLVVFRGVFFRNQFNRRMSAVVLTAVAGICVHRAHGLLEGRTIPQIVSGDALIGAVVTGLGAIVLGDRRLIVPSVLLAASSLLGAVHERAGFVASGISVIASVLFITLTTRAQGEDG